MQKAQVPEELVWASVTGPRIPLVYLDLNHYIELAKVVLRESGQTNADGRCLKVESGYPELLDAARRAKDENRAMFPLSSVHYTEVAHSIKKPNQRGHVADIMEELSGFSYILGRSFLAQLEITAGLDELYGTSPSYASMPLLKDSALWAFGQSGGFKIIDEVTGEDVTHGIRRELGDEVFDKQLAEMDYLRERKLLEGPQESEIAALRARGYAPETHGINMRSRLGYERKTSEILDIYPYLRRERLRDVIFAREISHERMVTFVQHLQQRREDSFRHELPNEADMVAFWAAMPQVQVAVSMKTRYHRNPQHRWKINHLADIDALSMAYAYCEAILTDKEARAALANATELQNFGAELPHDAREMAQWLDALPAVADPHENTLHPLR